MSGHEYGSNVYGMEFVGVTERGLVFVSDKLIATLGIERIKEHFGLTKRWPVVTDLNGNFVMVAAETQKEAVEKYLNRAGSRSHDQN